ncbi:hypothetical protein FAZ95_39085 [Trinickia violacea]|uniref:Uncharacterized protein n=1 Tax=Trinickia violacea TaxID=2571746 RepID=A0A4P8J4T2_9BURK|nr:hypothetical protein [Trinickia violacea]QCP55134.1 hypothetical protein FAZ95_39085 [Trinickia violacea]
MLEPKRFYRYRGFEIGLQAQRLTKSAHHLQPYDAVGYRCMVRIRKLDSVLRLDSFSLDAGGKPFDNEFEAILHGCAAAERRINVHLAMVAREPHLADVLC